MIANYQYKIADVIGIQSKGNSVYFKNKVWENQRKIEVLENWLTPRKSNFCSLNIEETILKDKKIFIYSGNMGIAQSIDDFIELAKKIKTRQDIGFLLIGRGSEFKMIKKKVKKYSLKNVLVLDEIDPYELPELYKKCKVGLISLNIKHKSHNIPGKFLSYLHSGLPVLASVNDGNDIIKLIESNEIGFSCSDGSVDKLQKLAIKLIEKIEKGENFNERCKNLFKKRYLPITAVNKIIKNLLN